MKRRILKNYFLWSFCIVGGLNFLSAQTDQEKKTIASSYDQQYLSQLSVQLSDTYLKDKKHADDYAKANNIPTVINKPNGGIAILHKVLEDGTLIYTATDNAGAATTIKADKLYTGGSLGLTVEGQGMTIGVWDGGKVRSTHELLGTDRIIQVDGATEISDHATHVTGTIIGAAEPNDGATRGMAFKANVHANDFGNDLSEMATQAASGLLISNHSYGLGVDEDTPTYIYGNYNSKAATLDNIMFNTPYYTMVKSAGNDRGSGLNAVDGGYDLITDMSCSKNSITVAAVGQVNDYSGPSDVVMSSFSSWGPTDDGRIKPDLSAKGVNTYSSTSDFDSSYGFKNGTSMSAPSITGGLALLQQLHHDLNDTYMLAATLKGLAIHTASEAGQNPGPDFAFGWGLFNVEDAALALVNEGATSIIEENTLNNGATYVKTGTALGTVPVMVTISWTDPAGPEQDTTEDDTTSRLVNDLDVVLQNEAGDFFYPWTMSSHTAAATKGNNVKDNVEKVEIDVPSGVYTITVSHKGTLVNNLQNFSLIVTGISESDFAFTVDSFTKSFCTSETGTYNFDYTSVTSYDGPTVLSATGLPAGAVATFTPAQITTEDTFTLDVSGLENLSEGTYNFTVVGTGTGTTDVKEVDLEMTINDGSALDDTTIVFPADGATDVFIYPTLSWTAVDNVAEYVVEVSRTPAFSSFLTTTYTTTETSLLLAGLTDDTTYYWRVKPVTICYTGNLTAASFTTETLGCDAGEVAATDIPKSINSTSTSTVESVITIAAADALMIGNIEVGVDITHSYVGDLVVTLISPEGTEVVLFSEVCGETSDVDVTFRDSGTAFSCLTTTPVINGIVKPQNLLNAFIGEDSAGDWTLRVVDGYDGDGGSLNNFSLLFCSTSGASLSVSENEIESFDVFPNPAADYFEFTLLNQQDDLKLAVYDINGRLLLNQSFDLQTRKLVDVKALSTGVYFVKITNGDQKGTRKLIIK